MLDGGWSVWGYRDERGRIGGLWHTDLRMEDADNLTDLLNRLDREQAEKAKH